MAQAAHAAGVSRFVFLSSLKAVGELTEDRPFNDASPAQPREPYGISKREAEIGLAEIAEQTGLEVVILRPPLLYGPGVEGNFRALLRLVGRGVPLPLGGIDNARSLLYVENLADAIAACLTSPAVTGGAYLIRDGEDLSTPELVRRLGAAMGRRVWLLPVPGVLLHLAASCLGRGPEAQRLLGSLRVDDSRLRDDLGWQPPFTVDQGLAATVASFRRAGA